MAMAGKWEVIFCDTFRIPARNRAETPPVRRRGALGCPDFPHPLIGDAAERLMIFSGVILRGKNREKSERKQAMV